MTTKAPSFAERIALVMTGIKRLGKTERNKHGGYDFVSVDSVKDQLRPLLAENGLFLSVSEDDYTFLEVPNSKGGMTSTARIAFIIVLSDGERELTDKITVMLPYTGAQTAGAARSYAVKEWLKGNFLISTGEDVDADHGKQEDYGRNERTVPAQQKRDPEPTQAEKDGAEDVKKAVMACKTVAALEELAGSQSFKGMVADLPNSLGQMVRREWSDRKAWLKSKEQTEASNDELMGNANAA